MAAPCHSETTRTSLPMLVPSAPVIFFFAHGKPLDVACAVRCKRASLYYKMLVIERNIVCELPRATFREFVVPRVTAKERCQELPLPSDFGGFKEDASLALRDRSVADQSKVIHAVKRKCYRASTVPMRSTALPSWKQTIIATRKYRDSLRRSERGGSEQVLWATSGGVSPHRTRGASGKGRAQRAPTSTGIQRSLFATRHAAIGFTGSAPVRDRDGCSPRSI